MLRAGSLRQMSLEGWQDLNEPLTLTAETCVLAQSLTRFPPVPLGHPF